MTSTQKSIICFRIMRQTTNQTTHDDHFRKVCIISTALMSTTLTAIQSHHYCITILGTLWQMQHIFKSFLKMVSQLSIEIQLPWKLSRLSDAQIPATFSYYSPHTMYQLLHYILQSPEILTDEFPTSQPIPDLEWPSGKAVICKMLPAMDGWYQM